ncbi:MAG: HD domain-containing protein [Planctomycetota bacterium]
MSSAEESRKRKTAWETARSVYDRESCDIRRAERMEEDRFHIYELLLAPLEEVRESPSKHPEGDALYHSLQVFTLARAERPYDEEFLLAALLHDVGKSLDPREHVPAALEALQGFITERTAWLIEHHAEAMAWREGTLGARSRRRLEASADCEELRLLARCDAEGRTPGMVVPDLREALDYLRQLSAECGE